MKRFGLFLLKNNIHIMTLIFIITAVWVVINWNSIELIQKLSLGAYAFLILHEYEEGYKGKFVALFTWNLGLDVSGLNPGVTHISQAVTITVLFLLPQFFPGVLFFTFAGFVLCIFEGFVHTMGIKLFRLGKPSPGWYTAILMAAYAIWAIVFFNARVDYDGIQWLWGILFFIVIFALMQNWFLTMAGTNILQLKNKMLPIAKKNLFGK